MRNKIITEIEEYGTEDTFESRQMKFNSFKAKKALKQQRRKLQLRLFGDHYNYSNVGLNKEKKYLLEQQKNTEIQRSNRILLEKIQSISKRSRPLQQRKRTMTDHSQGSILSDGSYPFKPRQFQSVSKSVHHLAKDELRSNDSAKLASKILFQGIFSQEGVQIPLKTHIQDNKFTISADLGKMKQKIHTSIDCYRQFFRQTLEADHSRIVEYLHFNGQLLEFVGVKKQKVSIEEQNQIFLPSIHRKSRFKTTGPQQIESNENENQL